jgi:hypothetical protein
MRVDVAQNLQLLVAAESVLAQALDGYAVIADQGGGDQGRGDQGDSDQGGGDQGGGDAEAQAWYAAQVCRDHVTALTPFLATYGQPAAVRPDGPPLNTPDLVLLGSLVALAWDIVAASAGAVDDHQLSALAYRGARQTHAQVDWLLWRLHREVFRGAGEER